MGRGHPGSLGRCGEEGMGEGWRCFAVFDIRSKDEMSGRTLSRLCLLQPTPLAGTLILYHLSFYRRTHSLPVINAGQMNLLECSWSIMSPPPLPPGVIITLR